MKVDRAWDADDLSKIPRLCFFASGLKVFDEIILDFPNIVDGFHFERDDRQIALGIKINQEDLLPEFAQRMSEVVGQCRLSHATLVVENSYYFGCHVRL